MAARLRSVICGRPRNSSQTDSICRLPKDHDGNHRYTYDPHPKENPVAAATSDAVNHPAHYGGDTPYEVIKVLEAWELDNDAYLFQVVKYVARAGKKDPDKEIEDLKKAVFYLNRKISNLEKK